jgi:hypothetical protein
VRIRTPPLRARLRLLEVGAQELVTLVALGPLLAKAFDEVAAHVRLGADLDVEVGTAVPGAQTVEVVLAGGHLLVGDFVREEAVLVEAGASQEPGAQDDLVRVVQLDAGAVALPAAPAELAEDGAGDVAFSQFVGGHSGLLSRPETRTSGDFLAVSRGPGPDLISLKRFTTLRRGFDELTRCLASFLAILYFDDAGFGESAAFFSEFGDFLYRIPLILTNPGFPKLAFFLNNTFLATTPMLKNRFT